MLCMHVPHTGYKEFARLHNFAREIFSVWCASLFEVDTMPGAPRSAWQRHHQMSLFAGTQLLMELGSHDRILDIEFFFAQPNVGNA